MSFLQSHLAGFPDLWAKQRVHRVRTVYYIKGDLCMNWLTMPHPPQQCSIHCSMNSLRDLLNETNTNYVLMIQMMPKLDIKCSKNKAGYTATEVACGWAGATFEVTGRRGQEQWGARNKIIKKVKCDQPTDRPTDRRTKRVVESRARLVGPSVTLYFFYVFLF